MNDMLVSKLLDRHLQKLDYPSPRTVGIFLDDLLGLAIPYFCDVKITTATALSAKISATQQMLLDILQRVCPGSHEDIKAICNQFFLEISDIIEWLDLDAKAIEQGDPAAKNIEEVYFSYPGFYAIAVYRFAHALHKLQVPVIPRMMTEIAHSKTGIDIHPAAQIGKSFFIDHGTGIVIGETSVIGNHVKIYQGVTLGALSVDKSMAETKRHPTIEDHVVIYASATILGGDTIIGKGSIIGGNAWITQSVDKYTMIYHVPNSQKEKSLDK